MICILVFFFALLLFPTPPLILGGWFILFLRFGLLGDILKRTSWLIEPQEDAVARGQSWLALTIGVFILLIMLFVSPLLVSLMQESKILEIYVSSERKRSPGTLALSFLYSPISLLLIVEAWLTLLTYFGLHYIFHRLKVSAAQVQHIKSIGVTTVQFLAILTSLIGFGWWSSLNPVSLKSFGDFSLVVLSPTTVLLTLGLVFMLFTLLNKVLAVEENTERHQQIAGRMALVLLSTFILLGLVGGGLTFLIHYTREPW